MIRNRLWLAGTLVSCLLFGAGCDKDGSGGGTDTGTGWPTDDGGVDSDTSGCNPLAPVSWGGQCASLGGVCEENATCMTPLGGDNGYCAQECCFQGDDATCTDISPGSEECVIEDTYLEKWFCAIVCQSELDCPGGLACLPANSQIDICYPSP